MTKLIDLSARKDATDLLVDCANMAVWYGFPEASRLLLEWMKHRSDEAAPILWIDALRSMRFEHFEDAKKSLRVLLERDPHDAHAKALLAHVLVEAGETAAGMEIADSSSIQAMDPSAQALLTHSRKRRGRGTSALQTPAYGAVIG
jgi:thioredoxin-like negative regulator of GroEL